MMGDSHLAVRSIALAAISFTFGSDSSILPGSIATALLILGTLCSMTAIIFAAEYSSPAVGVIGLATIIVGMSPGAVDGPTTAVVGDLSRYLFVLAAASTALAISGGAKVGVRSVRLLSISIGWSCIASLVALASRRSWHPTWVTSLADMRLGVSSTYVLFLTFCLALIGTTAPSFRRISEARRWLAVGAATAVVIATGTRSLIAAAAICVVVHIVRSVHRERLYKPIAGALVAVAIISFSPAAPFLQTSVERTIQVEPTADDSAIARASQWSIGWQYAVSWPGSTLTAQQATVPLIGADGSLTRETALLDTPITTLAKLGLLAGSVFGVLVSLVWIYSARRQLAMRTYLVGLAPMLATSAVLENRGFALMIVGFAVFARDSNPVQSTRAIVAMSPAAGASDPDTARPRYAH